MFCSPRLPTCTLSPTAIRSARIIPLFSPHRSRAPVVPNHQQPHGLAQIPLSAVLHPKFGKRCVRAQVCKYAFKIPSPARASGKGKRQHWPQLQRQKGRTPADIPRWRRVIWGRSRARPGSGLSTWHRRAEPWQAAQGRPCQRAHRALNPIAIAGIGWEREYQLLRGLTALFFSLFRAKQSSWHSSAELLLRGAQDP